VVVARPHVGTAVLLALPLACGARTGVEITVTSSGPCSGSPLVPIAIPAPTVPKTPYATGTVLTVTTNAVYFTTGGGGSVGEPSEIARVALLSGGAPDSSGPSIFPADFGGGPLVNDGVDLYFPSPHPGRTSFDVSPEVLAAPLEGGAPLDLPPVDNTAFAFYVVDLFTNRQRGVFFAWNGGPADSGPFKGAVDHWNGVETRVLASFPDGVGEIVVDTDDAFAETASSLYAVPLPEGPPVKLRPLAVAAQLFGLNADALFFAPDLTSIVRRDRATGVETVLVEDAALLPEIGQGHTGWVDSSWVYYVTGSEGNPNALFRVGIDGGTPEAIWTDPNHPPSGAVATDACNIYWLTSTYSSSAPGGSSGNGPSILMVRTKQ
jgi:hypothetical protein